MDSSTVTIKGQIVIPYKLRRKYAIKRGTRINFYEDTGAIKMIPVTHESIDASIGFLNTKGKLLRALTAEKKLERDR